MFSCIYHYWDFAILRQWNLYLYATLISGGNAETFVWKFWSRGTIGCWQGHSLLTWWKGGAWLFSLVHWHCVWVLPPKQCWILSLESWALNHPRQPCLAGQSCSFGRSAPPVFHTQLLLSNARLLLDCAICLRHVFQLHSKAELSCSRDPPPPAL